MKPSDVKPFDDGPDNANALRRSVQQMARRLRGLRSDHGVSGSKLSVLGHLNRHGGPMTASELARLERLQPQSLTRIIAELDEEGLIERQQDPSDRRQIQIALHPRGARLLMMDAHRHNQWLARAMETQLTRAERAMLRIAVDLLDRLSLEPDVAERDAHIGSKQTEN